MATTEVSDILTISDCLEEANVYGVQVPGDGHLPSFSLMVFLNTISYIERNTFIGWPKKITDILV